LREEKIGCIRLWWDDSRR